LNNKFSLNIQRAIAILICIAILPQVILHIVLSTNMISLSMDNATTNKYTFILGTDGGPLRMGCSATSISYYEEASFTRMKNYIHLDRVVYDSSCNSDPTGCEVVAFVGGSLADIDPPESYVVHKTMDLIRTRYPEIYSLITTNPDITTYVNKISVEYRLSDNVIIDKYAVEWVDRYNFSVGVGVLVDGGDVVLSDLGIYFYKVGDWLDLMNSIRSRMVNEIRDSIKELEEYGFEVKDFREINPSLNLSDNVLSYAIMLNGWYVGFDRIDDDSVQIAGIMLQPMYDSLSIMEDYDLLKHVITKYGLTATPPTSISNVLSEENALNKALDHVKQRRPDYSGLSLSGLDHKSILKALMISEDKYIPVYSVTLGEQPIRFRLTIDAVTGKLLKYKEYYAVGGASSDINTSINTGEQAIEPGINNAGSGANLLLILMSVGFASIIGVAIYYSTKIKTPRI